MACHRPGFCPFGHAEQQKASPTDAKEARLAMYPNIDPGSDPITEQRDNGDMT